MDCDDKMAGVFAIVLAAGSATRFGATKQLAEFDGKSLVGHAVEVANNVCQDRCLLVVGHNHQVVAAACRSEPGFMIVNDKHAAGLGTSLALAVKSIRHVASAVIVLLADQPRVTAQHIRALADSWSGSDKEIVATSFAGIQGPPVLFPAACFDALAGLTGDRGGRHLFDDQQFRLSTVVFEPASIDIDTPEDLTQI